MHVKIFYVTGNLEDNIRKTMFSHRNGVIASKPVWVLSQAIYLDDDRVLCIFNKA